MQKTGFSFKYNGKVYTQECIYDNSEYRIDDTLTVTVKRTEYKAYNAAKWLIFFENKGSKNSGIISDICDADIEISLKQSDYRPLGHKPNACDRSITWLKGSVPGENYWQDDIVSATEFSSKKIFLANKPIHFQCRGSRSSDDVMPFFDVKSHDAGVVVAIGWTGGWVADYVQTDKGVNVKAGLPNTAFYIKPGEIIRTASILVMEYSEREDGPNKFRRLIKNHFSHRTNKPDVREGLMAFEFWGGLNSKIMLERLEEFKKYDYKYEDLWLDAGWYGKCEKSDSCYDGEWAKFTGDWEINSNAHKNLLTDVCAKAAEVGMRMMLWVEIERATNYAAAVHEHPEWFMQLDGSDNNILNLGNETAWQFAFDVIDKHIHDLNLSCYRQDFNTELTEFFAKNDEPDRVGITEILHIMGMYRLWDEILAKYPDIIIDNCSSGGRRIDIETLGRSIPMFRSDYQCNFNAEPEVLQAHNTGISRYLPYSGCTTKTKSDIYASRSCYSSSFGNGYYNAVFQSMSEEDFKAEKRVCDEYRRIRKYFSCDFYNFGTEVYDETAWTIWQYNDPESNSGIVMAFRHKNSPFDSVSIELKGVAGDYSFENLNSGEITTGSKNLKIDLPEKRSCVIYIYSK